MRYIFPERRRAHMGLRSCVRRRSQRPRRLSLERLEQRDLLAAGLLGPEFSDVNASGIPIQIDSTSTAAPLIDSTGHSTSDQATGQNALEISQARLSSATVGTSGQTIILT